MKTGSILCISIAFFFLVLNIPRFLRAFFSISTPNIANTIFSGSYTTGHDVKIHLHCSKI